MCWKKKFRCVLVFLFHFVNNKLQQKLFPRFGSFNDGFLLLSFMCPFSISYTWSAPFSRVRTNAKWLKFYFRLFFTSLFSRHMSLHVISVNDHLHDNFDVSPSLHPNRWEFFKICTKWKYVLPFILSIVVDFWHSVFCSELAPSSN